MTIMEFVVGSIKEKIKEGLIIKEQNPDMEIDEVISQLTPLVLIDFNSYYKETKGILDNHQYAINGKAENYANCNDSNAEESPFESSSGRSIKSTNEPSPVPNIDLEYSENVASINENGLYQHTEANFNTIPSASNSSPEVTSANSDFKLYLVNEEDLKCDYYRDPENNLTRCRSERTLLSHYCTYHANFSASLESKLRQPTHSLENRNEDLNITNLLNQSTKVNDYASSPSLNRISDNMSQGNISKIQTDIEEDDEFSHIDHTYINEQLKCGNLKAELSELYSNHAPPQAPADSSLSQDFDLQEAEKQIPEDESHLDQTPNTKDGFNLNNSNELAKIQTSNKKSKLKPSSEKDNYCTYIRAGKNQAKCKLMKTGSLQYCDLHKSTKSQFGNLSEVENKVLESENQLEQSPKVKDKLISPKSKSTSKTKSTKDKATHKPSNENTQCQHIKTTKKGKGERCKKNAGSSSFYCHHHVNHHNPGELETSKDSNLQSTEMKM